MPSHGSLTKAGKIRSQNPKRWNNQKRRSKTRQKHGLSKGGLPYKHLKKHLNPKKAKRRRYNIWYNEKVVLPFLIAQGRIKDRYVIKKFQRKRRRRI